MPIREYPVDIRRHASPKPDRSVWAGRPAAGHGPPAQIRLASSGGFVETTHWGAGRCRMQQFGVLVRLADDAPERFDEQVERFQRFRFGRLDQKSRSEERRV